MLRALRRRGLWSGANAVALLLGVLAACLRLPLALTTPFWQDEIASARILAEPTLPGVLHHVVRTESTPPLWYLAGWLLHLVGMPFLEVRLLSVAEDALLVAGTVLLAARLVPRRFAALTGALVAVGAQFSAEGRWIRAYELFALLTVVLVFALLRAAAKPTYARLGSISAAVAAGTLTHYFFFFTVVAAFAWAALEPEVRAARRRLFVALAAGLLPFAAWSPAFAKQFQHRRYGWIGSFDAREVVETPLRLFTPDGSGTLALLGGVATLAVCLVGCRLLWRIGPAGRLCALLAAVPLAAAAAAWAAGIDVYAVRNMIGIGPYVAVAWAAALAALPARANARALVPAAVLAAAAAGFLLAQHRGGPAYDRMARALVAHGWRPGDDVAVFGSRDEFRSPLEWYLPGRPLLSNARLAYIDEPVFVVGAKSLAVDRIGVSSLRRDRRLLQGANVFSSREARSRS